MSEESDSGGASSIGVKEKAGFSSKNDIFAEKCKKSLFFQHIDTNSPHNDLPSYVRIHFSSLRRFPYTKFAFYAQISISADFPAESADIQENTPGVVKMSQKCLKMLQTVRGTPQLSFDGYGIILRPIQTDLSNIEISKQMFFVKTWKSSNFQV